VRGRLKVLNGVLKGFEEDLKQRFEILSGFLQFTGSFRKKTGSFGNFSTPRFFVFALVTLCLSYPYILTHLFYSFLILPVTSY
jgi:hypothetical protein